MKKFFRQVKQIRWVLLGSYILVLAGVVLAVAGRPLEAIAVMIGGVALAVTSFHE